MFIELTECLRCPVPHDEVYCVLASDQMEGRDVRRGTVGCPSCHAEYPIIDGVLEFGRVPALPPGCRDPDGTGTQVWDPSTVHALLGLGGPGGYVVLLGSAAGIAGELAVLQEGVHVVGINPPPDVWASPAMTVLRSPHTIPLRTASVRGAVVGSEYAHDAWLREAARVLLRGLRLIVLGDGVTVAGVRTLAAAGGLWVGERTPEAHSS